MVESFNKNGFFDCVFGNVVFFVLFNVFKVLIVIMLFFEYYFVIFILLREIFFFRILLYIVYLRIGVGYYDVVIDNFFLLWEIGEFLCLLFIRKLLLIC